MSVVVIAEKVNGVVEVATTEVVALGIRGPQGSPGEGVPAGGTTGQALVKASDTDNDTTWATIAGGGGGTTDHGSLLGLADDDHTQYHNNTRGDARYYTQSQLDTALSGKSNTGHTHTASEVTDFDTEVSNNADVAANTAAKHTHANKALLDTYSQTEADIADSVTKKHTHTNQAVLDATTASFTTADEAKLDAIEANADVTDAGNVGSAINGSTEKTTPIDADVLPILDSAASNVLKKSTWANIKATLKTYLDTLYASITHSHAASEVISGTFADARISESSVTQHQAALAITESQISDLDHNALKIRGVDIDSSVGTPNDGDILVYRSAGSDFVLETKPAGGSNPALNDVTDVNITSVADKELLAYDSTSSKWINQTLAEAGLASAAQGALADSALQSGGNISELTNDAGYLTSNAVSSVNTQTGVVVLDADDISDSATTKKFTNASDISKLAGIEAGATADQSGAEIKAAYEAEADTNAYTDAEKTKLAGIETGADVTDATNVAAAGALMASNNLSEIASAATARANLGLDSKSISFGSISPDNDTIYLSAYAPFAGTIESIQNIATSSGTITAAIKINGTDVTGLSNISVSSTEQDVSASGSNTFVEGDKITLVLSSNSSAANLRGALLISI